MFTSINNACKSHYAGGAAQKLSTGQSNAFLPSKKPRTSSRTACKTRSLPDRAQNTKKPTKKPNQLGSKSQNPRPLTAPEQLIQNFPGYIVRHETSN